MTSCLRDSKRCASCRIRVVSFWFEIVRILPTVYSTVGNDRFLTARIERDRGLVHAGSSQPVLRSTPERPRFAGQTASIYAAAGRLADDCTTPESSSNPVDGSSGSGARAAASVDAESQASPRRDRELQYWGS